MSDIQEKVTRAFDILDEICGVLESGSDPQSRATALRAWRTEHEDRLRELTTELRKVSPEELKPAVDAEQPKHPRAGKAVELAMASYSDPEFAEEWQAVSQLLGGAS